MIVFGILIPFFGTALGAAAVFLMRKAFSPLLQVILSGFAAGVMFAASVWSLLLPAIEQSQGAKWLPPTVGFLTGVVMIKLSEQWCNRLEKRSEFAGKKSLKTRLLVIAVTLHNIPEGMAVGVAFAGTLMSKTPSVPATAMALALGIAIQNIPEGAIISMPLRGEGCSKRKAFVLGALSGAVEPIAATGTLLLSAVIVKLMPFLLSFAAGAMVYVCVSELIPDAQAEHKLSPGVFGFAFGFLIMMVLDVQFGT